MTRAALMLAAFALLAFGQGIARGDLARFAAAVETERMAG